MTSRCRLSEFGSSSDEANPGFIEKLARRDLRFVLAVCSVFSFADIEQKRVFLFRSKFTSKFGVKLEHRRITLRETPWIVHKSSKRTER
jgi:hypothetical protein